MEGILPINLFSLNLTFLRSSNFKELHVLKRVLNFEICYFENNSDFAYDDFKTLKYVYILAPIFHGCICNARIFKGSIKNLLLLLENRAYVKQEFAPCFKKKSNWIYHFEREFCCHLSNIPPFSHS